MFGLLLLNYHKNVNSQNLKTFNTFH